MCLLGLAGIYICIIKNELNFLIKSKLTGLHADKTIWQHLSTFITYVLNLVVLLYTNHIPDL